jgi:hypothetical protein
MYPYPNTLTFNAIKYDLHALYREMAMIVNGNQEGGGIIPLFAGV